MRKNKDEDEMDAKVVEIANTNPDKPVRRTSRKRTNLPPTRIEQLECFPKVDKMVRAGEYVRNIATFIQDEAQEYLDVSRESLIRAIRRYRASLEQSGTIDFNQHKDEPDTEDPMYQLRAMEEMFDKQKGRIEMEMETEIQLKKLFSTTHKEFEVFNQMGTNIIKLKKIMGLLDGDNKRKTRLTQAGRLDVPHIIENPESRQRVLAFMENLMDNPDVMDDLVEAQEQIIFEEPVLEPYIEKDIEKEEEIIDVVSIKNRPTKKKARSEKIAAYKNKKKKIDKVENKSVKKISKNRTDKKKSGKKK